MGSYGAMTGASTAIADDDRGQDQPDPAGRGAHHEPEDVAPPARRRDRRRRATAGGDGHGAAGDRCAAGTDIEVGRHETRTRGSNTVYSTSVIRLTITNAMPTISEKPCTTL